MLFTEFPQELVDLFIDALVADRTSDKPIAALKACALTCKSLNQQARVHLFRAITITYNIGLSQPTDPIIRSVEQTVGAVRALLDTLVNDRRLAKNVRSFQLSFRILSDDMLAYDWAMPPLSEATDLLGVLRALHPARGGDGSEDCDAQVDLELESQQSQSLLHTIGIHITGGGESLSSKEWDVLHEDFRSEFDALCKASRGITTFSLEGFRGFEMGNLLRWWPHLRTLRVVDSDLILSPWSQLRDGIAKREETAYPYLQLLEFHMERMIFVPQAQAYPELFRLLFGSVKRLQIQPMAHLVFFHYVKDIWPCFTRTLETLKIVRTTADQDLHSTFNLPVSFPSLRTLIIELRTDNSVTCCTMLTWLTGQLERWSPPDISSLETMRVDIITSSPALFGEYEVAHLERDEDAVFWDPQVLKRLGEVLSGPGSFDALNAVSVRVFLTRSALHVPIDDPSLVPHHRAPMVDLTPHLKLARERLEPCCRA